MMMLARSWDDVMRNTYIGRLSHGVGCVRQSPHARAVGRGHSLIGLHDMQVQRPPRNTRPEITSSYRSCKHGVPLLDPHPQLSTIALSHARNPPSLLLQPRGGEEVAGLRNMPAWGAEPALRGSGDVRAAIKLDPRQN